MIRIRRLAAVVAVLALAACGGDDDGTSGSSGGDSTATSATDAGGGGGGGQEETLVIAAAQTPSTLEVEFGVGYENVEAVKNMHATLVRNPYIDAGNGAFRQDVTSFEPELAESWEVTEGGKVVTFKLKQGLKSVEGNDLTADDVVYTFERKLSTNSISTFLAAPALSDPSQVKKIDEYTVEFTLNQPYEFTFFSMLANFHVGSIYDQEVLEAQATADDPWAIEWVSKNGNYGFGPYRLVTFEPGQQLVWEANPNYVHGEPEIDRIIVRAVPESSNRAALVQAGDAHIAQQMRPRELSDLNGSNGVYVPDVPTNMNVFLPINTSVEKLSDPLVRQAIAYAIPYDRIIEDVYIGRARIMNGPIAPDLPGYAGDATEAFSYDPAKAKELLSQAGVDSLDFTLSYDLAYADLKEVAIQIQSAAQEAGINVTLNEMPTSAYQEAKASGGIEVALDRDYAIVQSPPYQLLLFFAPGSPLNWAQWEDEEFLGLVDEGLAAGTELSDAAAAKWVEAQVRLRDEQPFVWAIYVDPLVAMRDDVTGYTHRTDNVLPYDQLSFAGA